MNRVVVTGMGALTPLGDNWGSFHQALDASQSGVRRIDEWAEFKDLHTQLAAPIDYFEKPEHYTRKHTRSMGRVALLSTRATEIALEDAGLKDDPVIESGAMGIAYGSSTGSTDATRDFALMLNNKDVGGASATTYIKLMAHTAPVNVAIFFGMKGRVITTSSACTSGSQGIGYAYEAIKFGRQKLMVAGGSEELCPSEALVFDSLYATSTKNDAPGTTPSPFDRDRDGLVIGEGAGTLVLEELSHAQARGAKIYAEIVGFGTNSDGGHITQPNAETMQQAMSLALEDAALGPDTIEYVNAHGTATERGDVAESIATSKLFGSSVPISSLKGHIGHTLGACGAIEAWASIEMMNRDWFAPTLNLENPDPACGKLDYIIESPRTLHTNYVMSNNFAFGGINTSLIFRRWDES